ncbi:MAG: 4-alpha-glucanotransferase, partial [Pseudomonadota bacterium]
GPDAALERLADEIDGMRLQLRAELRAASDGKYPKPGPGDGRRGRSGELGRAMRALGGLGAAFFGVNPVHALGAAHGGHSPYSPTHRVFLDPAIARVPDHDPVAVPPAPDTLIDHAAARAAHDDAMRRAFFGAMAGQGGPDAPLGPAALAAFRARHGPALEAFALFEALSLDFGADWRAWPTGFEAPDTPAAAAFAARRGDEVTYHAWLQLAAETALAEAQAAARAGGMALGLYTDLAVGVRPDGAEIWAEPGVFARGVSLGAPPDMFSPDGQSWGLAPFAPPGLAAAGYAPFVAMLRAAMRHAGLVRIDHVLGLERTFWVPEDGTPGGYVRAEREVLLAILRVEAVRHGCGVVGEDLGVVPEGLREALDGAGIFGCSVAMYEHWEGRLRAPWHYRPATLASFGTHDTPTLAGWWRGHDIGWREHIGHTAAAEAEAMRAARWRDRATLMALMAEAGVLPPGYDPANPPWEVDDALIAAVHALLARAASALVAVQLDDALGTLEQANIPGTIDEHPNWRRRHAAAAEALGDHPLLRQIAKLMRDAGRVPVREIAEPAAGRG